MKTALILLADGFEEIEAITPIDLLRRAKIDVTTATIRNIDVIGSHGITIKADKTLSEISDNDYDMIILPGGGKGTENLADSEKVLELIRQQYAAERYVVAICAAPTVLHKAGILDNHTVTSYPSTKNTFTKEQYRDDKVVVSGKVITSRGAGTAIDFALQLIETLADSEQMLSIKNEIIYG